MAVVVRQPHDDEGQRSEERPMLLRHVAPNSCAPFELHAITYASETLDRLLAGVKGRCSPGHDSAAIMDPHLEKTLLIRSSGLTVHTSSYNIQSRSVDSTRS
jgi:hypothetical protein